MHEAHIAFLHSIAPESGLKFDIGSFEYSEMYDVSEMSGQSSPDSAAAHSAVAVADVTEPFAATSCSAAW